MNDMAHAVLQLLEENKIDHTLAEHPAVFNMEELYAQGLEHCDAIAKNLLVRDQKKRFYWLLVLYGEKRADLKALKARLGHGALSFAGAEELAELLPGARILRMDQDSTAAKDAHEKLLAKFANHEYDIMVGTQMVAKGLDFANVTLVLSLIHI